MCVCFYRFEIEKKLREAKKKEQKKKKEKEKGSKSSTEPGPANKVTASQRSQDRRKIMESKKDTKKMSALEHLKARREEKKKAQGTKLWFIDYVSSVVFNDVL